MAKELTTREAILEAAVRNFLTLGYGRTSMEQVASSAGVGRRTVYNQFESKKALFDATLARLWKRNPIGDIVSRIDRTRSPEEGLTQIGSSIADFWVPDESVSFLRMIIAESTQFPELVQTFTKAGQGPARRAISSYLQELTDKGQLHVSDPSYATSQFVDLIIGPIAWFRLLGAPAAPSKERRRQVVSETVEMFLARYGVSFT